MIPTYNNEKSLASVIQDVLVYTNNIIIVNDGSLDDTVNILSHFSHLTIFNSTINQGKGTKLKKGIKLAVVAGHKYDITIDSDGQPYADDLDTFLMESARKGGNDRALLPVADRNMWQDGIPMNSTSVNKVSSLW